jgi:multidrug resistance efflux pump
MEAKDSNEPDLNISEHSLFRTHLITIIFVCLLLSLLFVELTSVELVPGYIRPEAPIFTLRLESDGYLNRMEHIGGKFVRKGEVIATFTKYQSGSSNAEIVRIKKSELISQLERINTESEYLSEQIIEEKAVTESVIVYEQNKKELILNSSELFVKEIDLLRRHIAQLVSVEDGVFAVSLIQEKESELNSRLISRSELQIGLLDSQKSKSDAESSYERSLALNKLKKLDLLGMRSELNNALELLELQNTVQIIAPADGYVEFCEDVVGKFYSRESYICSFKKKTQKDNELVVEIYIPADLYNRVEEGSVVDIRVNSYPYFSNGKISAVLIEVSSIPVKNRSEFSWLGNEYRLATARIVNESNQELITKLRAGNKVKVELKEKERKLIYWLFSRVK